MLSLRLCSLSFKVSNLPFLVGQQECVEENQKLITKKYGKRTEKYVEKGQTNTLANTHHTFNPTSQIIENANIRRASPNSSNKNSSS
jgi:hypothetical protein